MNAVLRASLAASLLPLVGCTLIPGLGVGTGADGGVTAAGLPGAKPVGWVYSTLYAKNAVLEINTVQSRVDNDPIIVPNGPNGLTMDPRGRGVFLYCTCSVGNVVAVIDRRNRQITRTISVGKSPFNMAITPNGNRGFVSNTDDDTVSVIDIPTNTVTQTILLQNQATTTGTTTPGNTTTPATPTKLQPKGIATNADGTRVYVACAGGAVAILQGTASSTGGTTQSNTSTGVLPANNAGQYSIQRVVPLIGAVSPKNIAVGSTTDSAGKVTNDLVYVTDPQANRLFFFNGNQATQAEVRDVQGQPNDVSVGRSASGAPDTVYVSFESRDALQAFDAQQLQPKGDAVRVEGRQPTAVEVSSLGNEVYVSLSGSNNVAVLERGQTGGLNLPQVFNLQQLNPAFIAPTGDLALGGFLYQ